jgi:dihydrofolate reductase
MNEMPKYVVAHVTFDPGWRHVTVIHGDVFAQISALKAGPGKSIVLLGSNQLCVSLMKEGLVDEFRLMVNPVVLASGTALFAGLNERAHMSLVGSREFKSGNILLTYRS